MDFSNPLVYITGSISRHGVSLQRYLPTRINVEPPITLSRTMSDNAATDHEKQTYEHHDGSSTGGSALAARFEGAPAGWDPETAEWDNKLEKEIMYVFTPQSGGLQLRCRSNVSFVREVIVWIGDCFLCWAPCTPCHLSTEQM